MGSPDDEAFGPVVVAAEPATMQAGEDPERIKAIQRRLQSETKDYQTAVAKRQMRGR